jgi:toxin ParE1/3/4
LIRRLRFSSRALGQLERFLTSFDDRRAAARLAQRLTGRLRLLKTTPRVGRRIPELELDLLREVILPPLRIVYRILPKEIRVLAVVHLRRARGP